MTSALYAGLLALMFLVLSIRVIRGRYRHRVPLGDGKNDDMQRRIRSHGNFVEYTPIFLILLVLVEYQGLPEAAVHGLGCLFLIGRISHAYGVSFKERIREQRLENHIYRACGMLCTFFAISFAAAILLAQYAFGLAAWA